MPDTTTIIDRDQRDGLYELVRNHLGSIEDLLIAASDRQRSTGYKVAPAGTSRPEGFTGLKHCSGPVDDFLV